MPGPLGYGDKGWLRGLDLNQRHEVMNLILATAYDSSASRVKTGCRRRPRTFNLMIQSHARCQLRHPAIFQMSLARRRLSLAPVHGFEPRSSESKLEGLPLAETGIDLVNLSGFEPLISTFAESRSIHAELQVQKQG